MINNHDSLNLLYTDIKRAFPSASNDVASLDYFLLALAIADKEIIGYREIRTFFDLLKMANYDQIVLFIDLLYLENLSIGEKYREFSILSKVEVGEWPGIKSFFPS